MSDSEEYDELVMESIDSSDMSETNEETADGETAEGESVSVAQEVSEEDPFKDSELVKSGSATSVSEDGIYTAILLSTGQNRAGNPDEDGVVLCIAYDVALTDSELLMTGVYGYSSAPGEEIESNSDDGSYSFKIDENTQFTMEGGESPMSVPLTNYKQIMASCVDSESTLEITVEGGVAKSISICK